MKCIVKDCQNFEHQGKFIESLCLPCHHFITTGEGKYSQAYRNTQRTWVGLTKEDRYKAIRPLYCDDATAALAACHSNDEYEAIEAKLREKNK